MQTTRHIVGARHGDGDGGVTVVVAPGPWSQPTCLVGADGGGQASRKVSSRDRPQDLLPPASILSPCPTLSLSPPGMLLPCSFSWPSGHILKPNGFTWFPWGGRACLGPSLERTL